MSGTAAPSATRDRLLIAHPRWLPRSVCETLLEEGTDAFRIADGAGWWVEKFGDVLLISTLESGLVPEQAAACVRAAGRTETHLFFRRLVRTPDSSDAPTRIYGAGKANEMPARERNVRFVLDFEAGYSCGLFLDQRANRARLRSLAPRRVLNLFAYTCSFSVVAALAGAETVSVDLSKAALQRGRANFAANDLSTNGHRFLADDVMDVLPRLSRRGEKFDAIIIDPPTFSRGRKGRTFRAVDGLSCLARLAVGCAAPGAHILLSTNASSISPRQLENIARSLGANAFHREPPLPDIPPARAARTLWFQAPSPLA